MSVLYYLGFWGREDTAEKVKDGWGWSQKPERAGGKIDWLSRRERVVEAFTLSWDAYERYAWGRSLLSTLQKANTSALYDVHQP